jgi:hypothetical protein
MYRNWLIGLSIIILWGVLGYLYYLDQSKNTAAPLPPVPNNPVANTPDIPLEDRKYAEKMEALEAEQKDERVQKVNDIELANKAIMAANPADCKEIVSEVTRWMCEDRSYEALALKEKSTTSCDSIKNTERKSICIDKIYIIQAKDKKDILICDMISDEVLRKQCTAEIEKLNYNLNIISSQASGSQSEIDCSRFTDEKVSAQCVSDNQKKDDYTLMNQAMKATKSSFCDDIQDKKIKSDCYDGIYFAQAKNSYSLNDCEKITSSAIKTQCVTAISTISDSKNFQEAIQTQSIDKCDKIVSSTLLTNCRDRIRLYFIVESWDAEECNTLKDTALQQACKNSLWTK